MTAWDTERPAPEMDLIRDCVHCGFCLPTCPSYAVFEEEMDSPRGRIVLMRVGNEEGSRPSDELRVHLPPFRAQHPHRGGVDVAEEHALDTALHERDPPVARAARRRHLRQLRDRGPALDRRRE